MTWLFKGATLYFLFLNNLETPSTFRGETSRYRLLLGFNKILNIQEYSYSCILKESEKENKGNLVNQAQERRYIASTQEDRRRIPSVLLFCYTDTGYCVTKFCLFIMSTLRGRFNGELTQQSKSVFNKAWKSIYGNRNYQADRTIPLFIVAFFNFWCWGFEEPIGISQREVTTGACQGYFQLVEELISKQDECRDCSQLTKNLMVWHVPRTVCNSFRGIHRSIFIRDKTTQVITRNYSILSFRYQVL